jgi:hypothetical protein
VSSLTNLRQLANNLEKSATTWCKSGKSINQDVFNRRLTKELNTVEEQMSVNPDSAYDKLITLVKPSKQTPEEAAKYALLLVEGKYKNDFDVSHDSLIVTAVRYYSKTKDHQEYARALMYDGVVKYSSHDFIGAIEQYKKAEEEALKTTDWYLLGLINSRIAYVYSATYDKDESMYRDKTALAYYKCYRK